MTASEEVNFLLPHGYVDGSGRLHREGVLRATAVREEIRALSDFRAYLRPQSFLSVLLARVVTRLGNLPSIDPGIIESLSEEDRAFLESLYRRVNGYTPLDGNGRE